MAPVCVPVVFVFRIAIRSGIDFIFSGIFVFCFKLGRLTVRATSLATLLAAARQWLRSIGNYLP